MNTQCAILLGDIAAWVLYNKKTEKDYSFIFNAIKIVSDFSFSSKYIMVNSLSFPL
jgi:hypothetical protein